MQKYLNKIAGKAAGLGLFLIAFAMAGLGLMVMFYLALFALVAAGLGILAAPLLRLIGQHFEDVEQNAVA